MVKSTGVVLIRDAEAAKTWWPSLIQTAVLQSELDRVAVFFEGVVSPPDDGFFALLKLLYSNVACADPTADVVPLCPACGWTSDRLMAEVGEAAVLLLPEDCELDEASAALGKALGEKAWPARVLQLRCRNQVPWTEQSEADTTAEGPEAASSGGQRWAFDRVAMGGTFDRLHAGHRLLLAASAAVCQRELFVGVSADALLRGKDHRELLQTYEQRERSAMQFLAEVRPGLRLESGPLRDPQEPSPAATEARIEAIVVSEETVRGARSINEWRVQHGFAELQTVIVPLVVATPWGGSGSEAKLGSSLLRRRDASLVQDVSDSPLGSRA